LASVYRPNPRLEGCSNPFRIVSEMVFSEVQAEEKPGPPSPG
jgi:hypothetical protein